jgi:hypothetical protein
VRPSAWWRLRLLARAAIAVAAFAAFGALGATGKGVASSNASRVSSACTKETARQLVERNNLNQFGLDNPVAQVLCGPFSGPGSRAMAITIAAPTCFPVQHWAVLAFADGDWRVVLEQPAYLAGPLVAVGSGIRETTVVHRPGDSRCFPSGGTRARVWRWGGSRLVAGAWTQVSRGDPEPRSFDSPSLNIACAMFDGAGGRSVVCQSRVPPQRVTLQATGHVSICRNRGDENTCNLGDRGEGPVQPLAYGRQITLGRFRCQSLEIGVRCTVIRTGKGFLINRDGARRIG